MTTEPGREGVLEPDRPRIERLLRSVERTPGPVPVRRVRKAYEQVADQLRELIMTGELSPGERLPNEALLAREFGVSRATVREALRVLAAQNLLRTAKGAGGGSYVTLPTVDHISEFLRANIGLLTDSQDVTLDELIEARELLEVPAARLAAARSREADLERLRASIPGDPLRLGASEQFALNKEFHSTLIECCGNTLLYIAVQPVFSALQTSLARSALGRRFHREINDHHRRIVEAIEAGDADAAGDEMYTHLEFLVPFYEKAWRDLRRTRRA
jgi:GntR family transcriptional repressor for pyruvate dehydrogenase complex